MPFGRSSETSVAGMRRESNGSLLATDTDSPRHKALLLKEEMGLLAGMVTLVLFFVRTVWLEDVEKHSALTNVALFLWLFGSILW